VYQVLAHQFNLGHVSNASALWLGMRPADIFVFVFLPPFLLDSAVRLDFFMFKKVRRLRALLACRAVRPSASEHKSTPLSI
jgi:hypothetical protein